MSTLKVEKKVAGDREDVYVALKSYLKEKKVLEKWGGKIQWQDKKASATVQGERFSGIVQVEDVGKAAKILVSVDLSFLMAPFQGIVKEELKKHLGRIKV